MKPLTKAVRSSNAEGRDWKKDLYRFLLNYRATPHSTTGIAPAELLFNRKIGTKLPELTEADQASTTATLNIQDKDSQAKQSMPTRGLEHKCLKWYSATKFLSDKRKETSLQPNLIHHLIEWFESKEP